MGNLGYGLNVPRFFVLGETNIIYVMLFM